MFRLRNCISEFFELGLGRKPSYEAQCCHLQIDKWLGGSPTIIQLIQLLASGSPHIIWL
ncbi:hypothetical protein PLICRDRAFT_467553 [Plicaturopsis crispa FD-325 SS-3]|nr:hypothetical protein PLICRDRAFT_467553 [Plicaturopsis crispa FD-325 SS-3]